MRNITLLLSLFLVFLLSQGCSVFMAAKQPEKVDLAALEAGGLSRFHVNSKLGTPVSFTEHADGTRTYVYEFYEGSETGWKAGRATFHFVADLFTIGLWELIAMPTELAIKGEKLTARAVYDRNDNLKQFTILGREKLETSEGSEQHGVMTKGKED